MSFRSRLWSSLTRLKLGRSFGVAAAGGLGIMMAGKLNSNAYMVAPYAFGGHFEGSSSYPKKPIIPYFEV
jgi:hypothetical protein